MTRALLPLLLSGCSKLGPGDFAPPFEQTSMIIRSVEPSGRLGEMPVEVTGSRDVGGEELPVVTLDRTVGGDPAPIELIGGHEPGRVSLGGLIVPHTDDQLGVELVLDAPLVVPTDGAPGDTRTVSVDGALTLGDPTATDPGYLPFEATTTVLEQGAIAPSPMGDIPGCTRVSLEMGTAGLTVDVEAWVRDDRGLVHAVVDSVPFGRFEVGPTEWTGYDDAGKIRVIQREGLLDASTPTFSLSTYDVDGDFLADKDTHAQMWLEVRWADAERARTAERPPVSESFGTVFGFFPSELVQADVSVLHPGDRDEGFVYWVAFVDEAAKNEPENGIAYSVGATHTGGEAVLAGAFIRYTRLP